MTIDTKVLWSDGIFLKPQHFQQQERWLKSQLWGIQSCCSDVGWGINELILDEAALKTGKIVVQNVRGLSPDGESFSFSSDLKVSLSFDVPRETKEQVIYLCIPKNASSTDRKEVEFSEQPESTRRYRVVRELTGDVESNHESEPVLIEGAELNLSVVVGVATPTDVLAIPIGKVDYFDEKLGIVLSKQFAATCTRLSCSDYLSRLARDTLGTLERRATSLAAALSQSREDSLDTVSDLLFLSMCNRYTNRLSHLLDGPVCHPVKFYELLLDLYGEASTYSKANRLPDALPPYKHADLTSSFTPLYEALRDCLEWMPKSRATKIPLTDHGHGIQTATVQDTSLMKSAVFVLGVTALTPADKLSIAIPRQTTVSSVEKLRDFVTSQIPGVKLTFLPNAPREIPVEQEYVYFRLETTGHIWGEVCASGTIALHYSGNIPELKTQMWAYQQSL